MSKRQKIGIILLVTLILCGLVVVISVPHPIFLKWLAGQAKMVGKPLTNTVYVDGKANHNIQIFMVERDIKDYHSKYLLLDFNNSEDNDGRNILCVHLSGKYVGEPAGLTKMDYDYISGRLFQSEVGGMFRPYNSVKWDESFDPHLEQTGTKVTFIVPPGRRATFKCDSVRIQL